MKVTLEMVREALDAQNEALAEHEQKKTNGSYSKLRRACRKYDKLYTKWCNQRKQGGAV